MRLMSEQQTGGSVQRVEEPFGVIWQLWRGGTLVDTYCPWNGDPRPPWMDKKGQP